MPPRLSSATATGSTVTCWPTERAGISTACSAVLLQALVEQPIVVIYPQLLELRHEMAAVGRLQGKRLARADRRLAVRRHLEAGADRVEFAIRAAMGGLAVGAGDDRRGARREAIDQALAEIGTA